ncbi:hypothetical protein KSP39_PZI006166 [Platanthera zijinensis]|uniref:WW domain-containing protein n=1 Tax=Platanthera zijinensis TaxID=2320716 RepID=A0AAP0BQQ8_9ASPA
MDQPKLSLGPSSSSSSESETNNGRKRKLVSNWEQTMSQTCVDLQLNKPLPFDWEQCLDLKSGRMYCINKNTLKRSEEKPKERINMLDLDLNISNQLPESDSKQLIPITMEETKKKHAGTESGSASDSGMVAIVCLNCYLLVMLYRSSPSCPNCKYMHTLHPPSPPPLMSPVKPLETLSLLH